MAKPKKPSAPRQLRYVRRAVGGKGSAKKRERGNARWALVVPRQAGLCGGSYYKREAILDALSDERVAEIDWWLATSG